MNAKIGSLFSGVGGLDIAVEEVFGGVVAWHVENNPAAAAVLAAHWRSNTPNLGDITKIDWREVEPIDILCGGFPCQDVSSAGRRSGIIVDNLSGLWYEFAKAIDILKPKIVVIENVRGLLSAKAIRPCPVESDDSGLGKDRPILRAMGAVLGDLSDLGYDAQWATVAASDVGAPHRRQRVFILAHPTELRGTDEPHSGDQIRQSLGTIAGTGIRDSERRTATRVSKLGGIAAELATYEESERGVVHEVSTHWGKYGDAIHYWEKLTRPPPPPTALGAEGNTRLSPIFAEWMMGWVKGWVTDLISDNRKKPPGTISRADALKIIGSGVCPQQALLALQILVDSREIEVLNIHG